MAEAHCSDCHVVVRGRGIWCPIEVTQTLGRSPGLQGWVPVAQSGELWGGVMSCGEKRPRPRCPTRDHPARPEAAQARGMKWVGGARHRMVSHQQPGGLGAFPSLQPPVCASDEALAAQAESQRAPPCSEAALPRPSSRSRDSDWLQDTRELAAEPGSGPAAFWLPGP